MKFIEERFSALISEMQSRGFETNFDSLYDVNYDYSVLREISGLFNNWLPSLSEMVVNVDRILLRIKEMEFEKQKPDFYKLRGSSKSSSDWKDFYFLSLS